MNKKSNNAQVVVANTTNVDAAATPSYDEVFKAIPAKEHRTFGPEDFNAIAGLKFPESVEEIAAFVKGSTPNKVYALCVLGGKTEAQRVAKLFLADGVVLKPSAASSFKSVDKGGSEFYAGKLAYGLLSYVKNS